MSSVQAVLHAMVKSKERKASKARIQQFHHALLPYIASLFADGSNRIERYVTGKVKKAAPVIPGFGADLEWTLPDIDDWTWNIASSSTASLADEINDALLDLGEDATLGERGEELERLLGLSTNKARMIARTSSIWAYNEGSLDAMEEMGVQVVEWQTGGDDLVCPFCSALNGVRVELGTPFAEGGVELEVEGTNAKGKSVTLSMTPYLDVYHPPLHPNCRCAMLPVIK
jgi:uncharacterized protein with gpF-like domain